MLLPLLHLHALWISTIRDFPQRNGEEHRVVRASDVQYVGVYGISGASLTITLGNDLNRIGFGFVKWFFPQTTWMFLLISP